MYTYKAKLDRVVDGDTIDANIDLGFDITIHKRIRLAGIDTPESRTRDLVEDVNINDTLVKEGYAVEYWGGKKKK